MPKIHKFTYSTFQFDASPEKTYGPKVGNAGGINIYKCFRSTSTISYLINRRGAAVVLKYNTPIRFEADMWGLYAKAGLLNIYSLEENLFSPRP